MILNGRWLSIALGSALIAAVPAQTPQKLPQLTPPRSGYSFPQRQTLNYTVDWRVFPAGTTTLHVEQDGQLERITASADSIGAVNLLYRVSDRFQSSFDRTTGCSTGFSKQLIEGRRQVNSSLKFDYAHGKALFEDHNLVSNISRHQEWGIPGCVSDLLSATFYAASQPLVVGQSFSMPVSDAMRTVAVTMKVEGREEVRVPAGTFQTLRVQPTAAAGVVKNRGDIWIWYTDDERHMPVQMRARLFWGTITFRLTSAEQK
ncbi:DUF3108 domain-containing protein [Acidipila rosea]|uniref:Uncharacterized protein DUF3108 n=1 Tax=Acidipila rosea TaxID=768535 RepID=A0A4R1L422_9BACT|nr:DUF3108 domain-containing protein [Acidipila rosea]TCK71780.1 uncharacterized protein DUF3108 [Acidipila rosea]